MSEQAKILAQMQDLVMSILKTGSASAEEGAKIDKLEILLFEQNSFKEINHGEYACQGEEIASLFFSENYTQAINKMSECEITVDDFFDFVEYHYDEEPLTDMFTVNFIADVNKSFSKI